MLSGRQSLGDLSIGKVTLARVRACGTEGPGPDLSGKADYHYTVKKETVQFGPLGEIMGGRD